MLSTESLFVWGQEQTLTAHAKSLRKHAEQRLMGYPFLDSRLHGNDALVLTLAAILVFICRDGEILGPQAIHINCSTRCPSVILISAASF